GRTDDMLIIRGVNLFPTQIEELILRVPQLTAQYQLIVSREDHLDCLEVRVEVRPEAWQQVSAEDLPNVALELQHHIKSYIGVTAIVTPVAPQAIERTVGKARRVLDRRTPAGRP
ncbi:MAG: phenylacetate--CoA ligase, partial [Steroidobacteraceae bacterium]|nr:phenylacetate--CoA ligase [Steroidobacteraceae bacterium]